jgi:hypothetical protein
MAWDVRERVAEADVAVAWIEFHSIARFRHHEFPHRSLEDSETLRKALKTQKNCTTSNL